MRDPVKHVWLLLIPGQVHGWEIVRGICRFAKNRRWLMTICNPRVPPTPTVLRRAQVDGMIGLIYHPRYIRTIMRRELAAVNLTRGAAIGVIPSVLVDDYRCGQMAADYFLSRGFRYLGYLSADSLYGPVNDKTPAPAYAAERERGFRDGLAASGAEVELVPLDKGVSRRATRAADGKRITRRQVGWLRRLPKPIAIFTAYDPVAVDLAKECQLAGVDVPDEVAILGVHNGQILCELSTPPLSSIDTASEQRGYLAAQVLDEQFSGNVDPNRTIVLPPVGIVSRASTDVIAVSNPIVAEALHYIRDHLADGVDVAEVLNRLNVSRRQLERCFRQELHRTPLQEIHRLRVGRALDLLATTDLSVGAVAKQAGYHRSDRMALAVRKAAGKTPLAYRAIFQDK